MEKKTGLLGRIIRSRLGGYRQVLTEPDLSRPVKLTEPRSATIVGGGIAGISAAAILADRGFGVRLLEKNSYLGGKVGSWPVGLSGGETTMVEHGFHAFFKQYYNLRRFLARLGAEGFLRPIDDYLIATRDSGWLGFQDVNTTPVLNMLSMSRKGVYRISEMIKNRRSSRLLELLRYDPERTFEDLDGVSFSEFADDAGLPAMMRVVFTTFARAFFAQAHLMSMAEMVKSFHFYFLSNDGGLLYDVLDDDFDHTFLGPVRDYLSARGATIGLDTPVESVLPAKRGFEVRGKECDYVVLAADVRGIASIAAGSDALFASHGELRSRLTSLKPSQRYAVLRVWLDREMRQDVPFFLFTDRVELLDSVSVYHRMEEQSRLWSERNGGSIIELHCYAVPDGYPETGIRDQLLREMREYFPELAGACVRDEHLQVRDDFTAFHTGLHATRPEVKTTVPGLYLAGDWVKLPCPAMLMEASCTSGIMAANEILAREGLQQELLETVPLRGLLR